MKRLLILMLTTALGFSAALTVSGCDNDGAFEEAGEEIDDAIDDASDAVEDAADEAEDEAEDAL